MNSKQKKSSNNNQNQKCSICTDPISSENPIISCVDCKIQVHILCYGGNNEKNWKCSPCSSGIKNSVCKLCVQKGGAFKKTTDEKWVHVLCALFTDGANFEDKYLMEPIDLSHVSQSKRNKTCMFCSENVGFSPLCSNSKCKNRLHITCAQKSDCLKEENKKDGTIKFRAYCRDHKPTSNRRISSGFVREVLAEKRQKNKKIKEIENANKEKSATLNSDWLSDESAETSKQAEELDDESMQKAMKSKSATMNSTFFNDNSCEISEKFDDSNDESTKKAMESKCAELNGDLSNYKSLEISKQPEESNITKQRRHKKKNKKRSHEKDEKTDSSPKQAKNDKNDGSMWWDPNEFGHGSSNGVPSSSAGFDKEVSSITQFLKCELNDDVNIYTENHACFKDEKMAKVSEIQLFLTFNINQLFS